ncbi:MAG: acyl-CoA synthetase FdrA [Spirochaetaceae bacterium]|nr:MAG: acyl-CoA synthetase FdrA [Spirochaetaceae bacterium]
MRNIIVRKDAYYDSVFLMLINQDVKKIDGIQEAVVAMGTDMNRDLLVDMGLSTDEVAAAGPNDLIIALDGSSEDALKAAEKAALELLHKKSAPGKGNEFRPTSVQSAVEQMPDANVAIFSIPGKFVPREARKALDRGLHCMVFSDNVSLDDEIRLKKLAREKGLLFMGPDCGTAIINGKPLCFANVVRRGPIGIVAASGSGLQELTCSIDKAGGGISQAIGTGGRDVKAEVGGIMMLTALEALAGDPETRVLTVISKPPAESVVDAVIETLKKSGKPSVVHFIGARRREDTDSIRFAPSIEDAAWMAVAAAGGPAYEAAEFSMDSASVEKIVTREAAGIGGKQKYLRGLFAGGTLAEEALMVVHEVLGGVYSNVHPDQQYRLKDPSVSREHSVIDLGDDTFTVGRPHPMIDVSIRNEQLEKELVSGEMALLLLDFVIGYGAHTDPAGAMAAEIAAARKKVKDAGGYLPVIASVTGTEADPQVLSRQRRILEDAGCVVLPSNIQAARLAKRIMEKVG